MSSIIIVWPLLCVRKYKCKENETTMAKQTSSDCMPITDLHIQFAGHFIVCMYQFLPAFNKLQHANVFQNLG